MRITTRVKGGMAALALLCGVALAGGPGAHEFDFGRHEYEARCAGCHGASGDGDGVNRPYLDRSPADLTALAREHGGEFPYEEFYEVVAGTDGAEGDMPCFATVYEEAAREDSLDVPYEQERYLETRLVALGDYVARLQVR